MNHKMVAIGMFTNAMIEKKAFLDILGPVVGGMAGAKASQLIMPNVMAVSPSIGRFVMGAGLLGGIYGGYRLGRSIEDNTRKKQEAEAQEIQMRQMGLI
jgi:hypothetical protein